MGKIAFIYPGQGAQKVGMGKSFYENCESSKAIYEKARGLLDMDVAALCFEENDQLNLTEYTQVAMVTTCLAMTEVLLEKGIKPDVSAGLSLGEYCAIVVAGGMTKEDAIRMIRKRGILMEHAVPQGEGAMSAVLGMTGDEIEKILHNIEGVTIANYNCPGQIVITGKIEAVDEAEIALKEAGAKRVVRLNVSGPFHSEMLKSAGEQLGEELAGVTLLELQIPYATNVSGEYVKESKEIKELLSRQVSSPVRWEQSVRHMIDDGVDTFVEIGPGKILAGFMKKINRNVTVYNVETLDDVDVVLSKLLG